MHTGFGPIEVERIEKGDSNIGIAIVVQKQSKYVLQSKLIKEQIGISDFPSTNEDMLQC